MATLTIRNIDPSIKERLRVRAAQTAGLWSAIVTDVVEMPARASELDLYDRIRARVDPLGSVELDLPPRKSTRTADRNSGLDRCGNRSCD